MVFAANIGGRLEDNCEQSAIFCVFFGVFITKKKKLKKAKNFPIDFFIIL